MSVGCRAIALLIACLVGACGRIDYDHGSVPLEITIIGDGSATVSDGDGLVCETSTCSQQYPLGTVVELAVAPKRSALIGFTGDCTGTSCITTMDRPRHVTVEVGAYNLVFVTSTMMTPAELVARGDGSPVVGGERACAERAAAAGLTGTFVPWISDPTTDAGTRIKTARGWIRLDNAPFADSSVSLLEQFQTFYPIRFDESGNDPGPRPTMSATVSAGQFSPAYSCTSWTSTTTTILIGNSSWGTNGWSGSYQQGCATPMPIVCFQTDFSTPLVVTPAPGRIAFRSALWKPGGGLASADAECMTEAAAAGYTGTFRALLATDTASAASRMDLTGAPWVRTDGIPLVLTAEDLMVPNLLSSLTVSADHQTYDGGYIWTGATAVTQPSAGHSCANWTNSSAAATARMSEAFRTQTDWFTQPYDDPCSNSHYLLCLEQ